MTNTITHSNSELGFCLGVLAALLLEERTVLLSGKACTNERHLDPFLNLVFQKLYVYYLFLCECMYASAHLPQCAFGGQILFSSPTIVGLGARSQVISLGGRFLNLLSHLAFSPL